MHPKDSSKATATSDEPTRGNSRPDFGSRLIAGSIRPAVHTATEPDCVLRLDRPGSYYLDRALAAQAGKHGIVITASHVSLDLNGYAVSGCPGSRSGIVVLAETGVVIRNGSVHGWGEHGIDASACVGALIDTVRSTDNLGDGLRLGPNSSADAIRACDNAGNGIALAAGGTLHDCTSMTSGECGILAAESCRLIDCSASANTCDGINAGAGSTIRACTARHNLGAGIVAQRLSTISECDVIKNESDGVRVESDCNILRSRCHGSRRGAGIHATGQSNRIDENTCTENRVGIIAIQAGNIICRNALSASADAAIEAAAGNHVGRLLAKPEAVRTELPWSNVIL